MKRIVIVSGIQLSTNPRVVKEADALAAAGYDVTVLGATLDASLAARDRMLFAGKPWRYDVVLDASSTRASDRMRWLRARVRRRFWRELRERAGVSSHQQLGYAADDILHYCERHPADLYILHNPLSLWVGAQLMRKGARVAVDMEDWYSEDLLPADRRGVPVELLSSLERNVLRGSVFSITTSHAMSAALADTYGCVRPAVVYNAFPASEGATAASSIDRSNRATPSLAWFSQVLGPGRGLETLMDSLQYVEGPVDIHLRGTHSETFASDLIARAPSDWRERIHLHSQISHDRLSTWIAEHDVGYAGEIPYCRSRDLSVTNKILQFLGEGVPVIASDTSGHREIAERADHGVRLFRAGDAVSLAGVLNEMLRDAVLTSARRREVKEAARNVSWEESARRLVEHVEAILPHRPAD